MVGIRVERVDMRHLDHGEQRQQGQTQQRRCPESVWLPAAAPTIIWLQSGQQIILSFKDTQVWTLHGWSRLHKILQILATESKPLPPRFVYTVDR